MEKETKDGYAALRLTQRLLHAIDREAAACGRSRSHMIETTLAARFLPRDEREIWDLQQVGLETGLTRRRIEGLIGRGEFPRVFIKKGGSVFWRVSDVRDWMAKNTKGVR